VLPSGKLAVDTLESVFLVTNRIKDNPCPPSHSDRLRRRAQHAGSHTDCITAARRYRSSPNPLTKSKTPPCCPSTQWSTRTANCSPPSRA
jgi:hypothetical protein